MRPACIASPWSPPTARSAPPAIRSACARARLTPRVLWGETHGHSGYAEGQGTAAGYFRYAKEDSRLDFVTLSEHDFWMDDYEWKTMQDLSRQSTLDGDHRVPRLRVDRHPIARRPPQRAVPHARSSARAGPGGEPAPQALRRAAPRGRSQGRGGDPARAHGRRLDAERRRARAPGRDLLHARHLRVVRQPLPAATAGKSGSSAPRTIIARSRARRTDCSACRWRGRAGSPPCSRRSASPTRSSTRCAARSVYATSGARILLDARLNGKPMGTRQPDARERKIECRVFGTAPIDRIDVVRNGEIVFSRHYLSAPLTAEPWVMFGLESSSDVYPTEGTDSPRPYRRWKGTLEVEGARVTEVLGAGLDNVILDQLEVDPASPNRVRFNILTRGRRDALLLKLAGASSGTTFQRRARADQGGRDRPAGYGTAGGGPAGGDADAAIRRARGRAPRARASGRAEHGSRHDRDRRSRRGDGSRLRVHRHEGRTSGRLLLRARYTAR